MKRILIALVVFLSIGAISQSALLAQKRDFRQGNQRGQFQGRCFEMLDLTAEQEEAIADLRYEHQMQAVELRSKLAQNRLKLEKLFDEENVDETAVMNIVAENNDIHDQLATNRMEMRLKMNSLLTPEQKEELKDRPGYGMGFGNGFGCCRGKGFGRGNDFEPGMGRSSRCPNF